MRINVKKLEKKKKNHYLCRENKTMPIWAID